MADGTFDTLRAKLAHIFGDLDCTRLVARGVVIAPRGVKLSPNGPTVYGGVLPPPAGLGVSGDFYYRQDTPGTANQRIYVNNAGVWTGIV